MPSIPENAAFFLAVAVAISQGIAWYSRGSKRRGDEASVLTGAAMIMVNELQEQCKSLKEELEACKARVKLLEEENGILRRKNAQKPPPQPPKRASNL